MRTMNFLRAFGNQRQIGRILSNRSIKRLHKASVHNELLASVILYSPRYLDTFNVSVSQRRSAFDFQQVYHWLSSTTYFNLKKAIDPADKMVTQEKFKKIVDVAFNTLLNPEFRSQSNPETVLFYYTGHGLEPPNVKKDVKKDEKPKYSSPKLDDVGITKEMLKPAAEYTKPERPLKGGEFHLHQYGCCDLEDLLGLWTKALTKSSTKKNKHLIIIADSCYSGMLVEDLKKLTGTPAPWNQNDCTVTVQSASRSHEPSSKASFSPCFAHFNKPENRESLRDLKEMWNGMRKEDKNKIGELLPKQPSPQLATTMQLDKLSSSMDSLTMEFCEIPDQGFPLTLFHDADFFNICSLAHQHGMPGLSD